MIPRSSDLEGVQVTNGDGREASSALEKQLNIDLDLVEAVLLHQSENQLSQSTKVTHMCLALGFSKNCTGSQVLEL